MSEFFYYGQKDTIQRLNELAGRGAVVASTTPKVGMSPLGGVNGCITPAWLDPNLPIQSNARICSGSTAKYGYQFTSSVGRRNWYKLATFAPDDAGTQENLLIRGTLNDGWLSAQTSAVTLLMGVRNGFYVEWHLEGVPRVRARVIVYKHPDLTYGVYAFLDGFANASFDITGVNTATYAVSEPVVGGEPAGTIVFDTSAVPGQSMYIAPRWQGVYENGNSLKTRFPAQILTGVGSSGDSFLAGTTISSLPNGSIGNLEALGLGVYGVGGTAYPGRFGFVTNPGASLFKQGYTLAIQAYDVGSGGWTGNLLSIYGDGKVGIPILKAGSSDISTIQHDIRMAVAEAKAILYVGVDKALAPSLAVAAAGLYDWNTANSVLYVGKNSVTGRSVSTGGTISTQGNDYAEYISKCMSCADVSAGQIIGITAQNKITDEWDGSVMFAVKSTAPSFVGGDGWASCLGLRPVPKAGMEPVKPVRREDVMESQVVPGTKPQEVEQIVTSPGETDDEWMQKQASFVTALTAYNIAAQQDTDAMAAFDAALEAARQKVDRIAIAGRVPVNVLGAQPGDYIVPVQDGAGIKGIAVHEDDLSMKQYLRAVGRVIAIEADGRAYVMVKSV
ncbi:MULTISPECIES: hypothetical protein [unclassified Janthinobacterium]|uniref:hypothetical protein n=1 Tax=unclassified Janthinobacterium TaxID=2610881 RepID=UPI00160D9AD2|nr:MULTISPECIES: hypothetical protein [unclassified Janthinobacterium]MBB5368719.1 hypothetical protein [Janthinobacterium sp. K2C7]MBB5381745.1 hypothetical protein [Janthinobacterium sp. K2Li3]MBB5387101.1 hypothetical protein [Janthinobacterium sp. K2E3]